MVLVVPFSFVRVIRFDYLPPEDTECILYNRILFLWFLLFQHFLFGIVLYIFRRELNLNLEFLVQDLCGKVLDDAPVFSVLDEVFLKTTALDTDHEFCISHFHELTVSKYRG